MYPDKTDHTVQEYAVNIRRKEKTALPGTPAPPAAFSAAFAQIAGKPNTNLRIPGT